MTDAAPPKKARVEHCWSSLQSRILTGGGQAETLYTAERGFPFSASELPHHHLMANTTMVAFNAWRAAERACATEIVGAWKRTLFM